MFKTLQLHSNQIELDKQEILKRWMAYEHVYTTLDKHDFQVEYFVKHFGIRVLDYALGVIQEDNDLGDCPVIGVLLTLFQKKNIPLDDIFLICVHLKNAFQHYLLEKDLLTHATLSELNQVMDHNFKGVIEVYTQKYYQTNTDTQPACVIEEVPEEKKVLSARDYAKESELVSDLIHDLDELDDEVLNILEDHQTFDAHLQSRSHLLLTKYNNVLNSLYEFRELSYMLTLIIQLLDNVDIEHSEVVVKDNIHIYLKSIIQDLKSWREQVFIKQSAQDIHFMDQTLLSSATQLEIMLMPEKNVESCEIDFF
ncbi:MAG: hypothetical protein K0U47_01390 [Epsilonproteobacteria bacterium]|nr:hypothetical protein [Campylobacterota bacterium]